MAAAVAQAKVNLSACLDAPGVTGRDVMTAAHFTADRIEALTHGVARLRLRRFVRMLSSVYFRAFLFLFCMTVLGVAVGRAGMLHRTANRADEGAVADAARFQRVAALTDPVALHLAAAQRSSAEASQHRSAALLYIAMAAAVWVFHHYVWRPALEAIRRWLRDP